MAPRNSPPVQILLFAGQKSMKLPKVRLSNLLLLMACFAILMAWQRDRNRLINQLTRGLNRSWANSQATGPPDTPGSGDLPTAWASLTPDGQREWIAAEYTKPIAADAIEVHETFNPGAVDKISAIDSLGNEITLWQGKDPAPPGAARSVSLFPVNTGGKKYAVYKLYLDSPKYPGWNEIDAIGIRHGEDEIDWAARIKSSSNFGQRAFGFFTPGL